MYDIEKYYQADSIADAIRALEEDPEAIVISGGSDVLVQIREGRLAGCGLVSIHGISELEGIGMEGDGTIVIRPATTFSHITNHPLIQQNIPILGNAVDQVGSPQVRNTGTIGGNVCNGVTSADSASSLFALNAVLELTGSSGSRRVPIEEFYIGAGKTVREHAELLTAIRIDRENYDGWYGHYIKYGKRNAMEIATLGCAVLVKLTEDRKRLADVRIAYGVAGPVPMRCHKTEETVRGRALDRTLPETLGKGVLKEVHPRSSWRASKEFRLQLVEELVKRAFTQAAAFGGGEIHA